MRKLFMLCTFMMLLVSGIIMSGCGKSDPLVGKWIAGGEGFGFISECVIEKKNDKEYLYTLTNYIYQPKDYERIYLTEIKTVPTKTPLNVDPNNANIIRAVDGRVSFSYDEKTKNLTYIDKLIGNVNFVKKTSSEFNKMRYFLKDHYRKNFTTVKNVRFSDSGPNPNLAAASVDKPVIDKSIADLKGLTWKTNLDEFKKKHAEFKDVMFGKIKIVDAYHKSKSWNKNYRLDYLNNDGKDMKDKYLSSVMFRNSQLFKVYYEILDRKYDKKKPPTSQEVQASMADVKKVYDEYLQKISKTYGAPYVEYSEKSGGHVAKWDTNDANIELKMGVYKNSTSLRIGIINNIIQDHANMENGWSSEYDARYDFHK